jgi:hypothetical protein
MLSGEWRIRKNDELETLFRKPSILETIKNKRLAWAGHVWRSQNPLIRIVLEENPTGKRPLGRPRLRWEDVVRNNVKALGGGSKDVCRDGPSGRIYRRRRRRKRYNLIQSTSWSRRIADIINIFLIGDVANLVLLWYLFFPK